VRKLISAVLVAIFFVFSILSTGSADDEEFYFHKKQNGYDTPKTFWRFEIRTPTQKPSYPPYFLWDKDQPFLESSLPLLFGNQIFIKKK